MAEALSVPKRECPGAITAGAQETTAVFHPDKAMLPPLKNMK